MPKKSTVRTQPNNIDTLCKAQKKTQREIAQKINFTEGYIAMVKRGKVSCVSMEFVEKLAAVLETQPEKIFPDYECSRQQAKENVRECRNGQAAGLKEAESRTQRIADKSGGQQPEDKFNVRTEPNHIADWCAIRGITQKELTYYAKVNADAVVQTNNSAHLEYGNDPDNITTTTPDVVTTPTYPVQIHKLIKDQQNSYLAGAIFRLYRSEEDANNNQNAIAVTGSNGTYTVDPEQVGDNKMYDMESIGDGTTVGTGMNLKLNGLAEGSYWLVETQAPDGYNKLTAPVKITITKSDTTNVDDWTIKQNDGVVDDKIIDIENTTGTLLPETGGMGTVIFTVIAVVMILGIAVSFVISRRKRA